MDVFSLLPSPPLFFSHFLKLALSILRSKVHVRKHLAQRRPPTAYDIHPKTGFFPPEPLPKLPLSFKIWEDALCDANGNLSLGEDEAGEALEKRPYGNEWRSRIDAWPVLSTESLHSDLRLAQRAHLVLAWLVSFYVHSIPPSESEEPIRVPRALAVPLMEVSRHLGLAPVLTFADTVLWNWELTRPGLPLTPENIRFVNTFSGTDDEKNFYHASALAELRGVEILRIIDDFNHLPNLADITSISKLSRDLTRLAGVIEDIKEVIASVRSTCDPHVFYWDIRPWFEGSDAKGPDGPGWIYEGAENTEDLDLSGPSAGQSSIMHALDIFLDIDHKLEQRRYPAPSPGNKRADHGFMDRMRRYMPGKHREYLDLLTASRSIRELALSTPALRDPYDAAVHALKGLRDSHMRIACLYIVTMSRSIPGSKGGCPVAAMLDRLQANRVAGNGPVRGTGGNELSLLLKAGRDATRRAMLKTRV
ncbi:Indoleamine 2,3-dioxygenase [Coprinellus micaceus]|uniref:Indoleamine 2,3-dioxygenase n=1 Tax=Coprinellus micaceus TaxID=71717 RepID=A0A4Y7TQJ0_COPMI|nr:Indoleamine 2,3-dioxygenase [Coprinellus micaceus]